MDSQLPHVAIAILNYNGRKHLTKYLPDVLRVNYPQFSVWVIDNRSTDDSVAFIRQSFPTVQMVVNETNAGFAGGYNAGLRHIEAPFILLLNSDVAVPPEFLTPLVETMLEDDRIAFVQPKVLADTQRTQFEYAGAGGGMMDILGYPFCRGRLLQQTEADRGQYNDTRFVFWASGAAMLARRDVLTELNGFYEFFFMHQEEIDLCWRAWARGYLVAYNGRSVVYHLGGGSLGHDKPNKTFFNFRNNLVMLARNHLLITLLWVLPIRLLLDGLAAATFFLRGRPGHSLAVARAWFAFFIWLLRPSARKWPGIRKPFRFAGCWRGSLLWQYYVAGKKSYSDWGAH